jgi:hypothetical protein
VYSIADILKPQFARTWQEAVAVVQELASVAGDLDVLPLPEDLSLTDEGTLVPGFAGEAGEPPVTALARLLRDLLEGTEAPEALRNLAAESAGPAPAHATVQSFTRALAFFERPGRTNELMALAGRLRAAGFAEVDPEKELERLRAKVASGDTPKAEDTRRRAGVPVRSRSRILVPVAALASVMGVLAVALVWGGPMLLEQLRGKPVVIDVSQTGVEPLPDSSEPPAGANGPIRDGKPAVATSGGLPSGGRRDTQPAMADGTALDRRSFAAPVVTSDSIPPGWVVTVARRTSVQRAFELTAGGLYSSADSRVEPPVLVRRQLPSARNPDAETGYFDLVVDQYGLVEQVRLVSPTNSFRERMLVSAAKAWQFRPARLDGRPVRYRVQIPITITEERR